MGRIPQEPAFDTAEKDKPVTIVTHISDGDDQTTKRPVVSAVSWPNALDFNKLKSEKTTEKSNAICLQHMEDLVQAGIRLTDAELTPMNFMTSCTKNGITIQADKAPVAGVSFPDLECVRHTAEFDINAKTVFDVYNRINYTEAIDAYTYLVEMVDEIDCSSEGSRFSWAHVAYTADKLTLPLLAHRDFVTFDFVDPDNLMCVSRSCIHPERPQTKAPKFLHDLRGIFSRPSRTLRSPLCYFLRVVPLGENKCRVVQFQYSDVGGIVPPIEQTKAVLKFGLDNMGRFYRLVKKTQTEGLKVGPGTSDYLADPLLPKWRQAVGEMIPGL